MNDGVISTEAMDAAKKAVTSANVLQHIVERRIEYLLGTLIAYQLGFLDQVVTYGSQCIA